MATTSLWEIRSRLDHVLDYIANVEKTTNPTFAALEDVIEYAGADWKTEQKFFVTGINCNPETAHEKMKNSLQRNTKKSNILAYHGYQSFASGEVSAEQAHAIGVQLAEELWGERFDVLVSTHLNTDCYHNHFVVCAVSFVDGKRYNYDKAERRHMVAVSDRLCNENELSVITPSETAAKRSYTEWKAEQEGKPTKRSLLRGDIDYAISQSNTPKQFVAQMNKLGYAFDFNRKYPTVKGIHAQRAFRLHRLGEGYTPEDIWQRIAAQEPVIAAPMIERKMRKYRCKKNPKTAKRITGFRALYYRYCYLLGVFPKNKASNKRIHYMLHDDLIKLDRITAQTTMLWANKIDTEDELKQHMEQLVEERKRLGKKRVRLRKQLDKTQDPQAQKVLEEQIDEMTALLRPVCKEVAGCKEILARSKQVAQTIRMVEQDERLRYQSKDEQGGTPDEPRLRRSGTDGPHEFERR